MSDEIAATPIEATASDATGVEASVVESTIPNKEETDFSRRFALLTRKEREIQQNAERIKGDLSAVNEYRKEQELIKANPLKFLEKNGWDMSKLVDFALNDQKETPDQTLAKMRAEIEELRNEKTREKQLTENQVAEKNIQTYKNDLKAQLVAKSETYELLNHYESYDMVYDVMNEHFQKTKQILDIDKVAAEVEKYLEGQLEKATATKKFKSKFSQSAPSNADANGGQKVIDTKSPSTLSNSDVSGSRQTIDPPSRMLSEDESKKRAAKILEEAWKRNKK